MTGGPRTSVPGVVGRHLLLRIQAVSHEVRTMVETETSYLVRAASVVVEHVHLQEHVHERAVVQDEASGGEFVDDRIRESE